MTTYIIYNSQFLAQMVSFKYAKNSKRTAFKWSFIQNIAKTKSCLILEYKADYVDEITGETIKADCPYNDFLKLAKDFCAYTEVEILDETWNLEL